jgi:methylglutamate dehydrogenase subunit B
VSFLLRCPQCGPRDVYEFRWSGEQSRRPEPGSSLETWTRYLYLRHNEAGSQQEWWYHRAGCPRWFLAVRDTRLNQVSRTFWPSDESPPTEEKTAPSDAEGPRV